ncbi:hypothetical protein GGR56DRAFT_142684 [Xylariaceae sp. FL0804]|nr:hypothetical protein GGR56DRAFT_142684 [Xylariaceae sp. FL0804]
MKFNLRCGFTILGLPCTLHRIRPATCSRCAVRPARHTASCLYHFCRSTIGRRGLVTGGPAPDPVNPPKHRCAVPSRILHSFSSPVPCQRIRTSSLLPSNFRNVPASQHAHRVRIRTVPLESCRRPAQPLNVTPLRLARKLSCPKVSSLPISAGRIGTSKCPISIGQGSSPALSCSAVALGPGPQAWLGRRAPPWASRPSSFICLHHVVELALLLARPGWLPHYRPGGLLKYISPIYIFNQSPLSVTCPWFFAAASSCLSFFFLSPR